MESQACDFCNIHCEEVLVVNVYPRCETLYCTSCFDLFVKCIDKSCDKIRLCPRSNPLNKLNYQDWKMMHCEQCSKDQHVLCTIFGYGRQIVYSNFLGKTDYCISHLYDKFYPDPDSYIKCSLPSCLFEAAYDFREDAIFEHCTNHFSLGMNHISTKN